MRFGKPIEHLDGAVKALSVKDEFLRYCAVGKQLAYAGYLTFDGIIFVSFTHLVLNPIEKRKKNQDKGR